MHIKKNFNTNEEFLHCYETSAAHYDEERSQDYEGKRVDRLQQEFVYRHLGIQKGKVIECGCGTGRILLPLAQKGLTCYGIDPSKNMLDQIKKKSTRKQVTIHTKQADIEHIPFETNTFDGVFSIHVLMHMPRIDNAIKEMYRVAKPGAKIIFDLPNLESPWTQLSITTNPDLPRTNLYTRTDITRLLQGYNYKIYGLFSYARTLWKIPVIKYFFGLIDTIIPLPTSFRTQYLVVISK